MSYSVTLPDSSTRDYSEPKSLDAIAEDIGSGLARATVAGRIGGDLVDASEVVSRDCSVELVTTSQPEALEVMRHSCAHLLGHALKQLIPEARMAIGPVIENGFYYDVETPEPLSDEFLPELEERMRKLAREDYEVVREVVQRERAMQVLKSAASPTSRRSCAISPTVKSSRSTIIRSTLTCAAGRMSPIRATFVISS